MNEDYRHQKYKRELELVEYEQFHELEERVEALEKKASVSPNLKKSGDFFVSPFFLSKGSREQSAGEFTNSGKLASADADVEVSQLQNFGSRRRRKAPK